MSKPKILGYIPLMYGAEYLGACIESMLPWVDKLIIVYVSKGSQGHGTMISCPESRNQLYKIASDCMLKHAVLPGVMEWHDCGTFHNESEHRRYIEKYADGYDLIFTLDADEVCEAQDMPAAIDVAMKSKARHIGINGFINFWRSFDWVCLDGFRPFRFINLKNASGTETELCKLRIYHFSTCQSLDIVRFKWNVSGHKNELKPGWIDNIYLPWSPENNFGDLHPVSYNLWNAVAFDKTTLPDVLKNHPNYNKRLV